MLNLYAAWVGFACGGLSGAIPGLLFHRGDWLGGYASWPRRMIRLGHISFWGLGLLNLAYALTMLELGLASEGAAAGYALMLGATTMPLVCYLSAWRKPLRHLFFIPASSVMLGVILVIGRIL